MLIKMNNRLRGTKKVVTKLVTKLVTKSIKDTFQNKESVSLFQLNGTRFPEKSPSRTVFVNE